MTILQNNPIALEFDLNNEEYLKVKKALTYTDKAANEAYRRFKHASWYMGKYGEEAYYSELDRLKKEVTKCLLDESKSTFKAYSGLSGLLSKILNRPLNNQVDYPEAGLLAWKNPPEHELRYFQKKAVEDLLKVKHGGVEIATGLGKSYIILHLVKELALKTVVMAPSTSIAEQLYDTFLHYLGSKNVGRCFGGKKDTKKLITIALPQTLINLEENSKEYQDLSKSQVFVADESHTVPAKTLSEVCFGLMAKSPYRFFFSATQMRNDGKDLLLEAIVGPIVYHMTAAEGIDQGFLAKPNFKMVKVDCPYEVNSNDPNENTREALYYNPEVIKKAAFLANNFVEHLKHPVLILIDEVEQFSKLLPYLKHEVGFAHGPLGENKAKVPEKYHESKHKELVKQFNDGQLPILVGTSCISTGTDIRPVQTIIYLRGGRSEIEVKQSIGRGTRLAPGKTEFNFIDFFVQNNDVCSRHAMERIEYYEEIYGKVEFLTI